MTHTIVSRYDNIRKKSWFVELFPWIGGGTSTAIYPNVYLSRSVHKNIYGNDPDPYKISTLIHEEEHINRIRKMGARQWYWRYLVNRRFRFEEELAATVPQLAYIKAAGLSFNLDRKARALSGHLYFWPVSRREALARLNDIWATL